MFNNLYKRVDAGKLLAKNPTLIGVVAEFSFYEHPTYGDEAGLIAVTTDPDTKEKYAWQTDLFDLPSITNLHDINRY